jgi:hypothetical protein
MPVKKYRKEEGEVLTFYTDLLSFSTKFLFETPC